MLDFFIMLEINSNIGSKVAIFILDTNCKHLKPFVFYWFCINQPSFLSANHRDCQTLWNGNKR